MRLIQRGITANLLKPVVSNTTDWREFRRQEVALVALNVTALMAVIALPALLGGNLMPLKPLVVLVVLLRVAEQLAELIWFLLRRRKPSARFMRTVVHLSIWLNVAFAWLAAMLSLSPSTHFVVLMVVPLIKVQISAALLEAGINSGRYVKLKAEGPWDTTTSTMTATKIVAEMN